MVKAAVKGVLQRSLSFLFKTRVNPQSKHVGAHGKTAGSRLGHALVCRLSQIRDTIWPSPLPPSHLQRRVLLVAVGLEIALARGASLARPPVEPDAPRRLAASVPAELRLCARGPFGRHVDATAVELLPQRRVRRVAASGVSRRHCVCCVLHQVELHSLERPCVELALPRRAALPVGRHQADEDGRVPTRVKTGSDRHGVDCSLTSCC